MQRRNFSTVPAMRFTSMACSIGASASSLPTLVLSPAASKRACTAPLASCAHAESSSRSRFGLAAGVARLSAAAAAAAGAEGLGGESTAIGSSAIGSDAGSAVMGSASNG
jgi:hypothetical protein